MLFDLALPIDDKRRLAVLRVRDAAFDAVAALWRLRKKQGMSQKDLSDALDRDPAWVSRNLAGPANWTMKTFGEFVDGLEGFATIAVIPKEDVPAGNFDIYKDIEDEASIREPIGITLSQPNSRAVIVNMQAPGGLTVSSDRVVAYAG